MDWHSGSVQLLGGVLHVAQSHSLCNWACGCNVKETAWQKRGETHLPAHLATAASKQGHGHRDGSAVVLAGISHLHFLSASYVQCFYSILTFPGADHVED
jgi:hypothetical protein